MSETTIDEIMAQASHFEEVASYARIDGAGRGERNAREYERATLRGLIASALAAKDAEIERLNHAYHQQREDAQARVDAAVLRALTAERERDRREADFQAMLKAEHRISGAYVDLRSIIGAMNPPSTQFESLTKYVSMVARKLVDERDALKQRLTDSGCDLQALKAVPAPGEWVEWKGGECPIAKTSACVVKFSDGEELDTWPAGYWRWTHCDNQDDNIIAYRIIP